MLNQGKRLLIFILLIIFYAGKVFAGEETQVEQVSIITIIDEVLKNNPELAAARSRRDAAFNRVPVAKSLKDLMVGADFEGVRRGTLDIGKYMDVEYMVSQEIPFPGKLSLRGKVALQEAKMADSDYKAKERDIYARAKSAYYDLYMVDRSTEVNQQNRDFLEQFARVAETRYAAGLSSQQDVLKAQVELAKLANELITLGQERETAVAKLNALLNRPTRSPLGIKSEVPKTEFSWTWNDLEGLTLEHRPELKAMEYGIKRAESSLTLARLEYMPDFTTRVEARQFDGEGGIREYDVFLGVNIPIWFWTKQKYQVKEAKNNLEEAKALYQTMKNNVLFEMQDALVRVESSQRLSKLYTTGVLPQAQQALEASQIGYQTGKVDFLNLIDSVRTFKDFQLEYYESIVKFEVAFAELEKAVGMPLGGIK
jgi:outer membrane protein TolC